jgi:hypothetical protein
MPLRDELFSDHPSGSEDSLGSPFLEQELFVDENEAEWKARLTALEAESPFWHHSAYPQLALSEPEELEDEELLAQLEDRIERLEEEADAGEHPSEERLYFEEAPAWGVRAPPPLEPNQRAWVLALDHSAIERLPDAQQREQFLRRIDWSRIEFPGNPPASGASATPEVRAHWRQADELFGAMARLTPERRVPALIRYHDVDHLVVNVPRQKAHKLFPEACDSFVRMSDCAQTDGVVLKITSSWRSRKKQEGLRRRQPNPKAVARGNSPHMYGLAVDLHLSIPGLEVKVDTRSLEKMARLVRMYRSPVYKWMMLRAREFGWYPYRREPWHWEYNPPGFKERFEATSPAGGPGVPRPPLTTPPAGVKSSTDLVAFVQRVLNATENERLTVDGQFGPLTRSALERFRKRQNLGAGGVLDERTEIALVQRALEELAQQSLFAKPGVLDLRTDEALSRFKASHGLEADATLDAATRTALANALERRSTVQSRTPVSELQVIERAAAPAPATIDYLGGKLSEFTPNSVQLRTAVFCPKVAISSNDVEVLLYVHGLLFPCPPVPERPTDLITKRPFGLGRIVDASNRRVILVVPFVAWKREQPHPLADPALLNRFVGEVLDEVGRVRSGSPPSLRGLILAGHSRAYGFLDPLAKAHADSEMSRGPLSRLTQVWAFDTAYTSPIADYRAWLNSNPNVVFHVFYREGADQKPALTRRHGRRFRDLAKGSGGRFNIKAVPESHCSVPVKRLPELLAASAPSSSVRELQFEEEYEEGVGENEQGEPQHAEHFAQYELPVEEEPRAAEQVWLEGDEEEAFPLEETADVQEKGQAIDDEIYESPEAFELDPSVLDIAEKTMAREELLLEQQVSPRWTRCFSATDVANVERVYQDNDGAASANSVDRCSCIVMLNVALGELLSLPLKPNRAREASNRIVQMGNLTTESVDKAMTQLRRKGYAVGPTVMNFYDRRNKTAGTLKPERLKTSVQAKVLSLASTKGCWFAFGLSIMDGYHSVLLLVDRTASTPKIYWLDQFRSGVTDDVTSSLDQLITDKTQSWWQAVMDEKGKGYNTTIRLWPLRHRKTQ